MRVFVRRKQWGWSWNDPNEDDYEQLDYERWVVLNASQFGNRSFRLQVDSPTSRSFRLHDQSRFAYTVWVDSPTLKSIRLH